MSVLVVTLATVDRAAVVTLERPPAPNAPSRTRRRGPGLSRARPSPPRTLLTSYRECDRAVHAAGYDVESRTAVRWNGRPAGLPTIAGVPHATAPIGPRMPRADVPGN